MMILINKLIINNKFLRYTPFWWWYRLINHEGFRFDDYYVWKEFWFSLNHGWDHMEYVHKFEEYWGKGSWPPEKIVLPAEDFDALVEKLNAPVSQEISDRFREILNKKLPWND